MDAKTPALEDKHLWLSIGGVLSILLAKYLKIEIDAATLATIGGIIVGYITNSKLKEAKVSTALIENGHVEKPAEDAKPGDASSKA